MKTVLQMFRLSFVLGAVVLMAACNKKEETTLNNIKHTELMLARLKKWSKQL